MEALKLIAKPEDGRLTVAVPDSLNDPEVEVIVLFPNKEPIEQKSDELKELHRRRMEHFDKAPRPHFPISKYDVYNQ